MVPHRKSDAVFVVIRVHSGFPFQIEAWRDAKTAQRRAKLFKRDTHLDYDEVGVFPVEIGKRADQE